MRRSSLLFLMLSSAISGSVAAADPQPLPIGSPAPDFSLPATDGRTYSLKDFSAAQVLVIVFTCNHCPTAQAYEDRIKQLVVDYQNRGVSVLGISPNDPMAVALGEMGYTDVGDSFEEMKIRARDRAFNFPYLYDGATSEVSMKYGPQATPHIFVFNRERRLRYTGRIDDGEKPGTAKNLDARNAIEALLAGRTVTVEKTKTFGCSIKWPDKRSHADSEIQKYADEKVTLDEISADELKGIIKNDGVNHRLINVWATWCGPCVTEFPSFVDMHRMYRNREFELITITLDEPERRQNAMNFLVKKQASMKNYIFKGSKYDFIELISREWEGALPYTLLIAPGGKILYSKQGIIDPLEIRRLIADHLGRIY